MLIGIMIGLFFGAPIGLVLASMMRSAASDDDWMNGYNAGRIDGELHHD